MSLIKTNNFSKEFVHRDMMQGKGLKNCPNFMFSWVRFVKYEELHFKRWEKLLVG
jgi:hypothetical protein